MISNKIIGKIIRQIHYLDSFHLCILFITYQNEELCLQTDNQDVSVRHKRSELSLNTLW